MPSNFVNDNLSVIGSAAFVFVTAYSLVGNSANKGKRNSIICFLFDYRFQIFILWPQRLFQLVHVRQQQDLRGKL